MWKPISELGRFLVPGSIGQGGFLISAVLPIGGGMYIPMCSQLSFPTGESQGWINHVHLFPPNVSIKETICLFNKWVQESRGMFRETTFKWKLELRATLIINNMGSLFIDQCSPSYRYCFRSALKTSIHSINNFLVPANSQALYSMLET